MLIWANSSEQKKILRHKCRKSPFFKCNISIFGLNEMTQISIICLSLTPGVPYGEKFVDKAFKSIKYSHVKKVVFLAIFLQSFNILPKV